MFGYGSVCACACGIRLSARFCACAVKLCPCAFECLCMVRLCAYMCVDVCLFLISNEKGLYVVQVTFH